MLRSHGWKLSVTWAGLPIKPIRAGQDTDFRSSLLKKLTQMPHCRVLLPAATAGDTTWHNTERRGGNGASKDPNPWGSAQQGCMWHRAGADAAPQPNPRGTTATKPNLPATSCSPSTNTTTSTCSHCCQDRDGVGTHGDRAALQPLIPSTVIAGMPQARPPGSDSFFQKEKSLSPSELKRNTQLPPSDQANSSVRNERNA